VGDYDLAEMLPGGEVLERLACLLEGKHAVNRSVYRPTVGPIAEYAASGTPRSDPFKTAQAILQITQVDNPPLRLLLGSDAFTIARAADEAKIASDERWQDLTLSTDAHDVSREDQTTAQIPADAPAATPTPTNAPLIFVATNRLKPGQLDAERRRVPGLIEFVEQNEPQLIAFNEYVNDNGTEVTVVQVHPDTASRCKSISGSSVNAPRKPTARRSTPHLPSRSSDQLTLRCSPPCAPKPAKGSR
jgi:hypothetical protein